MGANQSVTCAVCGKAIRRRSDIVRSRRGLAHEDCVDPVEAFERNRQLVDFRGDVSVPSAELMAPRTWTGIVPDKSMTGA